MFRYRVPQFRSSEGKRPLTIVEGVERLQNTGPLRSKLFTCVEVLCRTRHNTIDAILIQ